MASRHNQPGLGLLSSEAVVCGILLDSTNANINYAQFNTKLILKKILFRDREKQKSEHIVKGKNSL